MLGQLPPCGTGDHEVMLDEDAYVKIIQSMGKKNKKKPLSVLPEINEDLQVFQEGCSIDDIAFKYEIQPKTHTAFPKQTVTFV
jgi:hypothetical protein